MTSAAGGAADNNGMSVSPKEVERASVGAEGLQSNSLVQVIAGTPSGTALCNNNNGGVLLNALQNQIYNTTVLAFTQNTCNIGELIRNQQSCVAACPLKTQLAALQRRTDTSEVFPTTRSWRRCALSGDRCKLTKRWRLG